MTRDELFEVIKKEAQDNILRLFEVKNQSYVGGRYAGTSIVERRATKLADSVLLREMERITKAIQDTFSRAKYEYTRDKTC